MLALKNLHTPLKWSPVLNLTPEKLDFLSCTSTTNLLPAIALRLHIFQHINGWAYKAHSSIVPLPENCGMTGTCFQGWLSVFPLFWKSFGNLASNAII